MKIIYLNEQKLNEQKFDNEYNKYLIPPFLYGESVFTSACVIRGAIPWWEEHKKRLLSSVASFYFTNKKPVLSKLSQSTDEWSHMIKILDQIPDYIADIEDGYLRISIFANRQVGLGEPVKSLEELSILVQASQRRKKINYKKCCTLNLGNLEFPSHIKCSSYANQAYWKRIIFDKGLDDYIRIAGRKVLEASTSNVFLYMGKNKFITPLIEPGILSGITRIKLIEYLLKKNYQCHEEEVTLDDLEFAEEVFLTNAVQGICPIAQLNGKAYKINMAENLQAQWPWGDL